MNKPSKLVKSVPYESSISVKPIPIGYCPKCKEDYWEASIYDPYPGKGNTCENEHEWELWAYYRYGNGCTRGVRKRLAWKCPKCDGYYFTRAALLDHEHWYI